MPFLARNKTTASCTLGGYFGLELLDSSGRQVGQTPSREPTLQGSSPQPGPLELRPGESARFLFEWGDNPVGGQTCQPASQVALIAPDQSDRTLLPARTADGIVIAPCGAGVTEIGPVTPG